MSMSWGTMSMRWRTKGLAMLLACVMAIGVLPPPPVQAEEAALSGLEAKLTINDTIVITWTADPTWQTASASIYGGDSAINEQNVAEAAPVVLALPASGTYTIDLTQHPEFQKNYFAVQLTDGSRSAVTGVELYSFLPRIQPGLLNLQHPHLFTTAEEIETIKGLVESDPWYAAAKKAMMEQGEIDMLNYGTMSVVPAKNNSKHVYAFEAARNLANLYALTGDTYYAEGSKSILLRYAEYYATGPDIYIYNQKKDDGNAVFPFTWAYDILYNSPVMTEEDRNTIENGLFRKMAEQLRKLFRYPMANQGVTNWAIATIGFLLHDQEYIEYAFDDPGYGLKYNMINGFLDDGLWWEETIGYHEGRLDSFIWLAEAARRSNYDLYGFELSGERNPIQPYPYPGRSMQSEGKSIKELLDLPLYYLFPNLSRPGFGDVSKGILQPDFIYEAAYNAYNDPNYAWVISQYFGKSREFTGTPVKPFTMFWAQPEVEEHEFTIGNGYFNKLGYNKLGSSVFMDAGQTIMRSEGDPKNSNNLAFKWDNLGTPGHTHADKLNIILFGLGKEILVDQGSYTYGTSQHKEYARHTIAHNTLVVDQRSMAPQKDTNVEFQGDPSGTTTAGYLNALSIGPLLKVAQAGNDKAYEDLGVSLNRTVMEIDDYVVDVFRATSEGTHSYDYPLTINGTMENTTIPLVPGANPTERLGTSMGYKYINNLSRATTNDIWQSDWSLGVNGRFRTTMLGEEDTEIIKGNGVNRSGVYDNQLIIARRNGLQNSTFFNVMEPYRETGELRNITNLTVSGEQSFDTRAAGIETPGKQAADVVMTGTSGVQKTAGGLNSDGSVSFMRKIAGEETAVAVVDGSNASGQTLALHVSNSSTAQLTKVAEDAYRLDFDGKETAEISLGGMPDGSLVYELALKDINELSPVAHTASNGAVSFTAEPSSIYIIASAGGAASIPQPTKLKMGIETDESTIGQVKKIEVDRQGILIEAEDFTLEEGGKVTIGFKNASHSTLNPLGDAFFGWDRRDHILGWDFHVAEAGNYRVTMRYASAVYNSVRSFQIDGSSEKYFYYPKIAGWNDRENVVLQDSEGQDLVYYLEEGEHTIRMTNFTGGLNLDYFVLTKVDDDVPDGPTQGTASLTGNGTVVKEGDGLELTVGVSELQGSFTALDAIVDYDPDVFTFDTVTNGSSVSLAASAVEVLNPEYSVASAVNEAQGKIRIIMFSPGEQYAIQDAGALFKLHAEVKAGATPGVTSVTLDTFDVSLFDTAASLDTSTATYSLDIRLTDNSALAAAIANAQSLHDQATEGTLPGQYADGSKGLLQAGINAASAVNGDIHAAQVQVDAALQALLASIDAFYLSIVPGDIADKTILAERVSLAQNRYNKAAEGNRIGLYETGSKETLHDEIAAANAVYALGSATQAQVDQAVASLDEALSVFAGKIVTLVPGAATVTITDLTIAARYYGVAQSDSGWSEIEKADVLNEGEINIETLAAIAQMILDEWQLGSLN